MRIFYITTRNDGTRYSFFVFCKYRKSYGIYLTLSSIIRLVKYFKTYFIYNFFMDFSSILKELREEKGLSQKQLAEKIGISQSAVAKWEVSRTEPTASSLILLAKFFDVTVGQLLGTEEY